MNKIELLSPAGDMEKMKYAYRYGADAVYAGMKDLSLRKSAGNFSKEELKQAVFYAHERKKKIYVTLNIIPRNSDLPLIDEASQWIGHVGADGIIVSDPGLIGMIRKNAPKTDIHISTQANTLNAETAKLFASLGAKRIILARELSINEIKEIHHETKGKVELEAFIHGAMCVSYSGRCLISNYMANRESNRGACAQPCRWKYALVEETRPGEYYPIEEDERGSFIMNSKDLCMIDHIPELIDGGLVSLKIEGRMKSLFYAASVTSGYRKAIDAYYADPKKYQVQNEWRHLVTMASHRKYTTGFYFTNNPNAQIHETNSYIRNYSFSGMIIDYDQKTEKALVKQKSPISLGDRIVVMDPLQESYTQIVTHLEDKTGVSIEKTPHPEMMYFLRLDKPVGKDGLIIKNEEAEE